VRLLLIQPSHLNPDGSVFKSTKLMYPGLALPIVAALTPDDFEIELVNEYAERINFDGNYDLVGISAMTPQAPRAYQIAARFMERGVKVAIGGFHGSLLPDEAEQHCDAVVIGEAETTWPQLIEDVRSGTLKKRYRGEKFVDMAEIPVPRYDLVKKSGYAVGAMPVQMTRGCPMNCNYCNVREFYGPTYRRKPIENVVRDVKAAGTRSIFFVDDNMGGKANREYCMELFEALKPLNIFWGSQCNVSVGMDDEFLRKASECGCFSLFLGVESVSRESLTSINKSFNDVDKFRECFQRIRSHGIRPMVSMMLGLDGDGPESFDATLEFLQENRIPIAYAFIITPGPGTVLFKQYQRDGRLLSTDWSKYSGEEVIFKPAKIDADTLQKGLWKVFEGFYSIRSILKRTLFPVEFNMRYFATVKYNWLHWRSVRKGIHPLRG